jgi:hypothetical protein
MIGDANMRKIKLIISIFGVCSLSTALTYCATSCGSDPDKSDIKLCNYTVKAIQRSSSKSFSDVPNFYIGPNIKGYVSGE